MHVVSEAAISGTQQNRLAAWRMCFYFKHGLLNTPCPPSPGARLRHLKTGFHNCLFTFISHQAFSHSMVGCDAGSAAAPALQPGELR